MKNPANSAQSQSSVMMRWSLMLRWCCAFSAAHFGEKGCELVLQSLCKQPSAVALQLSASLRSVMPSLELLPQPAKARFDTTPLCAHPTRSTVGNIVITITLSGGAPFLIRSEERLTDLAIRGRRT